MRLTASSVYATGRVMFELGMGSVWTNARLNISRRRFGSKECSYAVRVCVRARCRLVVAVRVGVAGAPRIIISPISRVCVNIERKGGIAAIDRVGCASPVSLVVERVLVCF